MIKTVILVGGRGSRMGLETEIIPKPMITIGGIPILRHIMDYYMSFGFKDFVLLGGYKIEIIQDYLQQNDSHDWNIELVDTGIDTPTGERLLRAEDLLKDPFFLTYGDGLGNIDLDALLLCHEESNKCVIISGVHPPGRFGTLKLDEGGQILSFNEKQRLSSEWVNGGFMVTDPSIFKYIKHNEMLEFNVFPRLVEFDELNVYLHSGWWRPMDTPRDREELEILWKEKFCPWRRL